MCNDHAMICCKSRLLQKKRFIKLLNCTHIILLIVQKCRSFSIDFDMLHEHEAFRTALIV